MTLTTLLAADPNREWSSDGEQPVHDSIKEGLRHVQHRMCAYCEKPLSAKGHVEHVHPRSLPSCTWRPSANCHYDWENLLLVCGSKDHCDGPKANKHLCSNVLFPDRMGPEIIYFVVNSLTGEIDVAPAVEAHDRGLAARAIQELHLNDPALKAQRLGVIKLIADEMQHAADAALVRHIATRTGGFLTTVESYLS